MFTFDDLIKLDSGSAQTLMRHVDKDKLGIALKSANEEVRAFFLGNMSSRAGKMLTDDMAAMVRCGCATSTKPRRCWSTSPRIWRQGRNHADQEPPDDELVY